MSFASLPPCLVFPHTRHGIVVEVSCHACAAPRLLSYVTAEVLDTAEQLRDMLGEVRERERHGNQLGPMFILSVMSS